MIPEDYAVWDDEDQEREEARLRKLGIIKDEDEREDDD